jgi:hypothetical protein
LIVQTRLAPINFCGTVRLRSFPGRDLRRRQRLRRLRGVGCCSNVTSVHVEVDGVVIVGWVGRSRRDAAERLHQILAGSDAPLLGVIANGSKSGGPSPYPGSGNSSPVVTSPNGASPSEQPLSTEVLRPTLN